MRISPNCRILSHIMDDCVRSLKTCSALLRLLTFQSSMLLFLSFFAQPVAALETDRYGGWTGLQGNNQSGFFQVEKINGRYWFVTPDNNVFWSIGWTWARFDDGGVYYAPELGYSPSALSNLVKYEDSLPDWIVATSERMLDWGFNTLSSGCYEIPQVAETLQLICVTHEAERNGCRTIGGTQFADVFDPLFVEAAEIQSHSLGESADNPYTIGVFPDNELNWVAEPGGYASLPDAFIAFPPQAAGKQYWVNQFLKNRYARVVDLNAAWGTGFTGWTGGGNTVINVAELPDDYRFPERRMDKIDFMEAIADRYYSVVTTAMREQDPNHLIFTDRYAAWAFDVPEMRHFNERIWKKAGEYCDVIAQNAYWDVGMMESDFQHITRQFTQSGKPFLITEHNYMANDSVHYDRWWSKTQMDRASAYLEHLQTLVQLEVESDPNDGQPAATCLGSHWYALYDEPTLGNQWGEAWQCGLLNCKDEAYLPLVDVMASAHRRIGDYLVDQVPLAIPEAPEPLHPVKQTLEQILVSSRSDVYDPDNSDFVRVNVNTVDDPQADRGFALKADAQPGYNQYIQYGPFLKDWEMDESVDYTVAFRLKTDQLTTSDVIATLSVCAEFGQQVFAEQHIRGTDFTDADSYRIFTLSFTAPSEEMPNYWEYRIFFTGQAALWIDTITVDCDAKRSYFDEPLNDGSGFTFWQSKSHDTEQAEEWLVVDLGEVRQDLIGLVVVPGSEASTGMPVDFELSSSEDGIDWDPIEGQSYIDFTPDRVPVTFNFEKMTARYLLLNATRLAGDDMGRHYLRLTDLEVLYETNTTLPTFEWNAVDGAAGYTFLLSPEACFPDGQTFKIDGIADTTYRHPDRLSPGVWHWTVRAVDDQGLGGQYCATETFRLLATESQSVSRVADVSEEPPNHFNVTSNEETFGDGTAWALIDKSLMASTAPSLRMVFTINSFSKTRARKNPGANIIPLRWTPPPGADVSASHFTFDLYPHAMNDRNGERISPSRYLYFRMLDTESGVIVDRAIDPTGALPSDAWGTVSIPLGDANRSRVSEIAFYIKTGDPDIAWDQRMVFNIDAMALGETMLQVSAIPSPIWTRYE